MTASASALLDQLMGSCRNSEAGAPAIEQYKDDKICKYYLCGFCPHELFTNTKIDTGETCRYMHNDSAVEEYKNSKDFGKLGFEDNLEFFCRRLVVEAERRVERSKERLTSKQQLQIKKDQTFMKTSRVDEINEEISELLSVAEQFGFEGAVDDAQKVMDEIDALKAEKDATVKAARLSENQEFALANEKSMEVCATCGAMIVKDIGEDQIRNHISGKQHTGFGIVREFLKEREDARILRSARTPSPIRETRPPPPPRDHHRGSTSSSRHHHGASSSRDARRRSSRDRDQSHRDDRHHHHRRRDDVRGRYTDRHERSGGGSRAAPPPPRDEAPPPLPPPPDDPYSMELRQFARERHTDPYAIVAQPADGMRAAAVLDGSSHDPYMSATRAVYDPYSSAGTLDSTRRSRSPLGSRASGQKQVFDYGHGSR